MSELEAKSLEVNNFLTQVDRESQTLMNDKFGGGGYGFDVQPKLSSNGYGNVNGKGV